MNHANHMFWLGLRIADRVIECGNWQQKVSEKRRDSKVSVRMPWMQDDVDSGLNAIPKAEARRRLGIPENRTVVLTAAYPAKYVPVADMDFTEVIGGVLSRLPDVAFHGVGMAATDFPQWVCAAEPYGNRLHFHPSVPPSVFAQYCAAADIYVDSFPFSSGGSVGVALRNGCVAVTRCQDFDYPDFMRFPNTPALVDAVVRLVTDPAARAEAQTACRQYVDVARAEKTRKYCEPIISSFMEDFAKTPHALHDFSPVVTAVDTNDYTILASCHQQPLNDRMRFRLRLFALFPGKMADGVLLALRVCRLCSTLMKRGVDGLFGRSVS